jgi:uncharacterized protein YcaQ
MMNEAQKWDAAQVVTDWCHRHGYDQMDMYEARSLLAALANAGYVVVDRERWERVLGFAVTHDDEYCKAWGDCLQPGDLDPLPTQEGE